MPDADNTIFIYIVGDNGASAEGGLEGSLNENLFFNGFPEKWEDNLEHIDEIGGPKWFNHFPRRLGARDEHAVPVDQAGRQPLRRHPQPDDHLVAGADQGQGGRALPVPPRHRHRADALRGDRDPAARTMLNGIEQKPHRGRQLPRRSTTRTPPETRKTQYFEMLVNRGMYHDGWMASSRDGESPGSDRSRSTRTAASGSCTTSTRTSPRPTTSPPQNPEKLSELQDLWWAEAARNNVLPLDGRKSERLNAELQGARR